MILGEEEKSKRQNNELAATTTTTEITTKKPSDFGSVIELYGPSLSTCGYCDNRSAIKAGAKDVAKGRRTYDIKAHKLTTSVYQQLIDRGWRRSGEYLYFPYNANTCCPNYGISCSATKFELTRTQKRCIEKVHSYLISGNSTVNKTNGEKVRILRHIQADKFRIRNPWRRDINYIRDNFDKIKQSPKARDRRFVASCERIMRNTKVNLEEAIRVIRSKKRNTRQCEPELELEDHLYPRKENMKDSFMREGSTQPKHKLEIRLIHVESEESKALREKEHEILVRYQDAIHKEPADDWTMSRFENFLVETPLKTEPMLDRDYFHQDTSGDQTSTRTLSVDLHQGAAGQQFVLVKPPQVPTHFGTYHCVYLLDGELIAVGVIDFLPKCLTTVYFFYDPQYSHLNLGIYSALVENSIVRQMYKHYRGPPENNQLKYYYMGFYVHQTKKMHYKTSFKPSYLLCPITRKYVSVEKVLPMLREHKYCQFDSPPDQDDTGVVPQLPQAITMDTIRLIPVTAPVLQDNSTNLIEYFDWLYEVSGNRDVDLLVERFLVPYSVAIGCKDEHLLKQILVRLDAIHRALLDRNRDSRSNRASSSSSSS